jgi:hypothetical protein
MKIKTRKRRTPFQALQNGQIWEMDGSSLRIGLVGKTLVHYKHYKGGAKRPPTLLSGKSVLERLLEEQHAILVQEPSFLTSPAGEGKRRQSPAVVKKLRR